MESSQSILDQISVKMKIMQTLIGIMVLFIIAGTLLSYLQMSPKVVSYIVPFEISTPEQIPFDTDESYASIVSLEKVKVIYKNKNEELVLWITTDIGWNNVSDWEEKVNLEDGTEAYYTEFQNTKMLSWQNDGLEYALDYSGTKDVGERELLKIADSIK
ncbi:DUF4367 domain-containing protein [Pseudalkalibacillus decolorationis]|uniref:DUF4367 domain-containing protein n=1 Tax=Pseudalkalibacillus decolorationis TaxID=163879 RepID=UPI002148A46A|nr:DUF4367 domain-containing protein [Pseudalkalibacillus decolorationis]